ncbi:pyridoxamine 5'-phosphate oxidase [Qipengyuania sp. YG27]|uniref:Pyridoxine/pyridoxamine 5'-phosphate oxidase n=1 Tax=Qipengyuania mesophila TaxID=2867246 RepID=A0ABS7JT68_9SPHN|nr:pyridoxamine 5'-phosphate oxidase [Qipengyuania mesophila]MBX7500858.1 pyridoxamine 5'-phosphate oxidase [Qipengyuania mesophila]
MTKDAADPFATFAVWYREAQDQADIADASAVNLATASPSGAPSNRMVLIKEFGPAGFVFYTNLSSRKAGELKANPLASLCFYWAPLGRQVRIEGAVTQVGDSAADSYFATRPIESRIGAWASRQSEELASRTELAGRIARTAARFAAGEVHRPPFWSGFRLEPTRMEFWTNKSGRLHDRIGFERIDADRWRRFLIYP